MNSTEIGGIILAISVVVGVFVCACIAVGIVISREYLDDGDDGDDDLIEEGEQTD